MKKNGIVRETEDGGSLAEHPMFPMVANLADLDLDTLERTVGECREMVNKLQHVCQLRAILRDIEDSRAETVKSVSKIAGFH